MTLTKSSLLIYFIFLMFNYSHAQWSQMGSDIEGFTHDIRFGDAISLSSDGSIIVVGAPAFGNNKGLVKTYQYNVDGWSLMGNSMYGEESGDYFGSSVQISADGQTIVAGAPYNDNSNGEWSGMVKIYEFDGSLWQQKGGDLIGDYFSDQFGFCVDISADGSIVAIGAYLNDENGNDAGQAKIFSYESGSWQAMGDPILGDNPDDGFGANLSLNASGTSIAIGTSNFFNYDVNTKIFNYNGTSWEQIGNPIPGETNGATGMDLSLNAAGNILAIGEYLGGPTGAGQVKVFENIDNNWDQIADPIYGSTLFDYFGSSVSINETGNRIAIGTMGDDVSGANSGTAYLYEYNNVFWEEIFSIEAAVPDDKVARVSLNAEGDIMAVGAPFNDANGSKSGCVKIYNPSAVNIKEMNSSKDILIYPNPSKGVFSITGNTIETIEIINITGRIVKEIVPQHSNSKVDLSLQLKGVYFVKIKSKTGTVTRKLIID